MATIAENRRACLAESRRARFDYEVLETFIAGIMLTGHEVKSLKKRGANFPSAHVIVRGNETFLIGLEIPSFQPANAPPDYKPERTRKLLLNKEEIKYLIGKLNTGLTIIPIKIYYNNRGLIKVEIALARGRKKHDKRELIKKRNIEAEIRRYTRGKNAD